MILSQTFDFSHVFHHFSFFPQPFFSKIYGSRNRNYSDARNAYLEPPDEKYFEEEPEFAEEYQTEFYEEPEETILEMRERLRFLIDGETEDYVTQTREHEDYVTQMREHDDHVTQPRPLSEVMLSANFLEQLSQKLDADTGQETAICEDNSSDEERECDEQTRTSEVQEKHDEKVSKPEQDTSTNTDEKASKEAVNKNAGATTKTPFQFNKVHETITSAFGTLKLSFPRKNSTETLPKIEKEDLNETVVVKETFKPHDEQETKALSQEKSEKRLSRTFFEVINDSGDPIDKVEGSESTSNMGFLQNQDDDETNQPEICADDGLKETTQLEDSSFEDLETVAEDLIAKEKAEQDSNFEENPSESSFDDVTMSEIEENSGKNQSGMFSINFINIFSIAINYYCHLKVEIIDEFVTFKNLILAPFSHPGNFLG